MMRRRAIITAAAILILGVIVTAYFSVPGRESYKADLYASIPGDACIVLETVDLLSFLNSLTTEKGLLGEASRINAFAPLTGKLKNIADNLNKPEMRDIASGGHALISFFPVHEGGLEILLSMSMLNEADTKQIRQVLESTGVKNITTFRYGRASILAIPHSKGADTLYLTVNSGLLLAGSSVKILKEGHLATDSGIDVRALPGFSRVLLASGNNADKLFFVFRNLPGVLRPMLSFDKRLITSIADIASVAGTDIYLDEGGLVLSGYTESTDSSDILYKYKFIRSSEFDTYRILPEGTALFETVIIQDQKAEKVDTSMAFPTAIRQFAGDELTRAYIDIIDNSIQQNNLVKIGRAHV